MQENLNQFRNKHYPMPFTRVDVAVLSVIDGTLQVLLAKRMEPPHSGKWALPGGVLRIDLDSSLDAAVQRVIHERLGTKLPYLEQLCSVGGPKRDPRAPWALSVVYRALLPFQRVEANAGKRIEALEWRAVDKAMSSPLAFDHGTLVRMASAETRRRIEGMDLPTSLMNEQFTLGELQQTCEFALGRQLDKSSFRRKLADRDLVVPIPGAMRSGAFRPAQLYRFKVGAGH